MYILPGLFGPFSFTRCKIRDKIVSIHLFERDKEQIVLSGLGLAEILLLL